MNRNDGVPQAGDVSIVVTVLDEMDAVGDLIDALRPQMRAGDELIVVDGGSSDGTLELLHARAAESGGAIRVVDAPGANISAGRNAGIAVAEHPVIACTDAGCRPWPGWLDALRTPFGISPAPDLVTGIYDVAAEGPYELAWAAACYPPVEEAAAPGAAARLHSRFFGVAFDPTLPTGRSVAFTKTAWERVGGFPEHLETSEDISFGRAIAASGGRYVLAPQAVVTWSQRPDVRATARMYFRYGLGGGKTGDPKLISRDLLRAVAYPAALALTLWGGGVSRALVGAGAGAYLSLPLWRSLRRPRQPATSLLVPAALAVKDLSKAAGCLRGLTTR